MNQYMKILKKREFSEVTLKKIVNLQVILQISMSLQRKLIVL